jgi:putative Holliday junction resolvase
LIPTKRNPNRERDRVATLDIVRVLGIDLGSKRIGLAISDEEGEFAFPAGILSCRGRKRDLRALRELIVEKQIGSVVIGLPIHMDGRRGPEAEQAIQFAKDLHQTSGIPVDTLDERWTSQEAERLLAHTPKKRGPKQRAKGVVDEMAASIILRTFLAQRVTRNEGDLD